MYVHLLASLYGTTRLIAKITNYCLFFKYVISLQIQSVPFFTVPSGQSQL